MDLNNKTIKSALLITFALVLSACGSTPQPTVELQTNKVGSDKNVAFAYIAPTDSTATTHIYGASCLLCYGVASALTSSLDTHLESTIDATELNALKELVIQEYRQHNGDLKVVTLDMPINKLKKFKGELGFAERDFRPLQKSLNSDVLIVLELYEHGAYRSFSNYVPNGDPQGYILGKLYTVDLSSNAYIQYLLIDQKVQPEGEWDEPSAFPGVTNAYYQAIENAKQQLSNAI